LPCRLGVATDKQEPKSQIRLSADVILKRNLIPVDIEAFIELANKQQKNETKPYLVGCSYNILAIPIA